MMQPLQRRIENCDPAQIGSNYGLPNARSDISTEHTFVPLIVNVNAGKTFACNKKLDSPAAQTLR